MRYPIDTGTEHLFEAGIWIGAQYNNAALRVSTASVTTSGGYQRGAAGFEFTADLPLGRRSTNPNDEFFSPFSKFKNFNLVDKNHLFSNSRILYLRSYLKLV